MARFSIWPRDRAPQTAPELADFEITPPIGVLGAPITLSWKATGYHTLIVNTPSGRRREVAAGASASIVLKLERSGTYQLAARNDYGTVVATCGVRMIELPDVKIPAAPTFSAMARGALTITREERAAVVEASDGYELVGTLLSSAPRSMPGLPPSIDQFMTARRASGQTGWSALNDVVDAAMQEGGARQPDEATRSWSVTRRDVLANVRHRLRR
nr:hypothetical protein [Rhodococcus sp. (in: high G+C Gram-positive bacteria)]